MGTKKPSARAAFLRMLAADAAGATAITLVAAFILASLSAAGIVTMTLATILLIVAWLVGAVAIFLIKPIWDLPRRHKLISLGLLGVMLFVIWLYEVTHQPIETIPGIASSDDSHWQPLSSSQIATLATRVKLIPPRPLLTACASVSCRDLADDFVTALNAGGWKAKPLHGGGIGVDGIIGMRIDQAGPAAIALQKAIQETTGLKVECVPIPPNTLEPETINLTIGIKPF